MNKSPKELFKIWHFVYSKGYDYNSEEGIRKYKVFKSNLNEIKAHNARNLKYKYGFNEHSDLTFEEFKAYYNIRDIPIAQYQNEVQREIGEFNAQKRFSLDNYNDDDDDDNVHPNVYNRNLAQGQSGNYNPINWTSIMNPVRNQGNCGSCWAFSTDGMIEGNWWLKYKSVSGSVNEWLSPQQLVDCDTTDEGCNGGWLSNAINYYKKTKPMRDSAYPYTGVQGTCKFNSANTKNIVVSGYKSATTDATAYALLQSGPVSVGVGVSNAFMYYTSGIFDGSQCLQTTINHAIILVGYGVSTSGEAYWIVRNSWGAYWGMSGYMYVTVGPGKECTIPNYAYQATIS